jgi:hypothetical protein
MHSSAKFGRMNRAWDPSFFEKWEARIVFVLLTFLILVCSSGAQIDKILTRLPFTLILLYGLAVYTQHPKLKSSGTFKSLWFFQIQGFSRQNPHILQSLLWGSLSAAACFAGLYFFSLQGLRFLEQLLQSAGPVHLVLLLVFGIPSLGLLWSVFLASVWGRVSTVLLSGLIVSTATTSLGLGISFACFVLMGVQIFRKYGYANLIVSSQLHVLVLMFLTLFLPGTQS